VNRKKIKRDQAKSSRECTFCCSAALKLAMRSSSALRLAASLASAASSRASRSASSLSVFAKSSRVFFSLLFVSGRRLTFSRASIRPNRAETSGAEPAMRDGGGTTRERVTCFSLFEGVTLGRTRGWSVICESAIQWHFRKRDSEVRDEPRGSGNRAGSWGF
jgi:hypothetical protein